MMRRRNGDCFHLPCHLLLLAWIAAHVVVLSESLLLNIHMPLKIDTYSYTDLCLQNQALASNLALRQAASAEQVDLFSNHTAHITLYLVDFDVQDENGTDSKLETILKAVQQAFVRNNNKYTGCRVDWPNVPTVQRSGYAMYFVEPISSCLRELSDTVVRATMQYIHRPPVIPDWIYSLPEPERRKMLQRIQKYGSPNVLDGFRPHVTVGYDVETPRSNRLHTLQDLFTPQPCFANLSTVAVGLTGVAGTVLQNGELLRFSILDNNNKSMLSAW